MSRAGPYSSTSLGSPPGQTKVWSEYAHTYHSSIPEPIQYRLWENGAQHFRDLCRARALSGLKREMRCLRGMRFF